MSALLANQKLDPVIKEPGRVLQERRLALLNEVQRIRGPLAKRAGEAITLLTAIRINAVCQTICKRGENQKDAAEEIKMAGRSET